MESVRESFKMMDINGDGKIKRLELAKVLQLLDPINFTEERISTIFQAIDADGDTSISMDEFLNWAFQVKSKTDIEEIQAGLVEKEDEVQAMRFVTTASDAGVNWLKGVIDLSNKLKENGPLPKEEVSREEIIASKSDDKKANAEYIGKIQFLGSVPLFTCLPRHEHARIAAALETVTFKEGGAVIKQGDLGDEFFVVQEGEASLAMKVSDSDLKDSVTLLKVGDYFGENELLRDDVRSATVTADTELTCLKLTRAKFHAMNLGQYFHFPKRGNLCRTSEIVPEKPPAEKTSEQKQFILQAVSAWKASDTPFKDMETDSFALISHFAWSEEVKAGECVVKANTENNYFYIVQAGTLEQTSLSPEDDKTTVNEALAVGHCFGWESLCYNVPSVCTVMAIKSCLLWTFSRRQFKEVFMTASDEKRQQYHGFLDRVEAFHGLLSEEKQRLADAVVEINFEPGEVIYRQGDFASAIYILRSGDLHLEKDGEPVSHLKGSQAPIFGQECFLSEGGLHDSTAVVDTSAKTLSLDRQAFLTLMGPLKDIFRKNAESSDPPGPPPVERIRRKDLAKVGLLGCGGFAAVELFQHKETGMVYAMKGISKGYIVKTASQDLALNEKAIMLALDSPFCIKLHETYNGSQSLYFLMEAALGGELYATYNKKGFHGDASLAKFYLAASVFALEHIHERRIVYRDIKPENMLIADDGHCKFCDFALSKFVINKTYTTCGTPDYFAPELIACEGHGIAVDWWTWSVLLFELLSGHPPFEAATPMAIYSKVNKGIDKIAFPPSCQGPVEHLIKANMKRVPEQRLAMQTGGTNNIKNHVWYEGYDWDAHSTLKMCPPYVPDVKSSTDLSNFSARIVDMPRMVPYVDPGTGWERNFAT